MLAVEKVIFCEDVVLNRDGSPRQLVRPFTRRKVEVYPHAFPSFTVSIEGLYTDRFTRTLTINVRGNEVIYRSAGADLHPGARDIGMNVTLDNVTFPEPGKYWVEILLDDKVQHSEPLILE